MGVAFSCEACGEPSCSSGLFSRGTDAGLLANLTGVATAPNNPVS